MQREKIIWKEMVMWLLAVAWTVFGGLVGWMVSFSSIGFYEQIVGNPGKAVFAFVLGATVAWLIFAFFVAFVIDAYDEEEEVEEKKKK